MKVHTQFKCHRITFIHKFSLGLLLVLVASCVHFKPNQYDPLTNTYNNYFDNYSLIVPKGFVKVDKNTIPDSLPITNFHEMNFVFKNQETGAYIGIERKPISSSGYNYWLTVKNSVDETGASADFSEGFEKIFNRGHGKFANSFEGFLIFQRLHKSAETNWDIFDAIGTYHVNRGSYEYSIFSVAMLCPSDPKNLLDLRDFLYDINLCAFTEAERVTSN